MNFPRFILGIIESNFSTIIGETSDRIIGRTQEEILEGTFEKILKENFEDFFSRILNGISGESMWIHW